jgi:type IV secretory pathway VirB2 component (pilin)
MQMIARLQRYIHPTISPLRRFGLAVMPLLMQRTGLAVALLALPVAAYAQTVSGGASPQTMINNVCTFILGPFGQTLAVLGIIAIGVLFMFGRASLGIIAGIIGGIVIMFGASYLGETLTGG